MRDRLYRLAKLALATCCLSLLLMQLFVLLDFDAFEFRPLYTLLGVQGLLFILVLDAGVCALLWRLLTNSRRRPPRLLLASNVAIFVGLVQFAWVIDWILVEKPLTVRLEQIWAEPKAVIVPDRSRADFDLILRGGLSQGVDDPEKLAVMYERIRLVNPETHVLHPIGQTIDHYSSKYSLDPRLLFFLAYVHSFWGEAVSGRVPFLKSMTGETVRDVAQLHLPGWFVESPTRRWLAESDVLENATGPDLGHKLRYAVHKATLDVSAQPYELNTFSDMMLVLQEYPEEFPDVLGLDVQDPVRRALRDSFRQLTPEALPRPYEKPYDTPSRDHAYYERARENLKKFARAAYYATVLDFDLSTRFGALLIDYQRKQFVRSLGQGLWQRLPESQAAALLGMTRDVYVPNIGRFGSNVYALPELNCTPVAFVAGEAAADLESLLASEETLWRPRNHERLWGAAGTKLRVFSEVWAVTSGRPFPGLEPAQTVDWSRQVVLMDQ